MSTPAVAGRTLRDLVYALRVDSVMSPRVISVLPDDSMSTLRQVLKESRISGVPVTGPSGLVGIISVEDVVRWLAAGGKDCKVEQWMTRPVETVFEDELLVHAIGKLKYRRVGRLPVLSRRSGELVGIVTKGDVTAGLLETAAQESPGGAPLLEDLTAGSVTLALRCPIRGGSVENGGETASSLRRALKRLGVAPDVMRRAAIILYEAEMNVIIYAGDGEASVSVLRNALHIEVTDRGPGIPDIEKAMQPGFSTAPESVRELGFGAGMGLPNIKRCSTAMRLTSRPGEGTRLAVTIALEQGA